MQIKEILKNIIKLSPIALSKNHLYDKQTKKIARLVLKEASSTVDVGCHKGEIMDLFLKHAPTGRHFGFEPIPDMFNSLVSKYSTNTNCSNVALSSEKGETSFNYVVSNPLYSGLKKRAYDKPNEKDTKITVQTDKLDSILPQDVNIDVIKIDVEGGEYGVLKGAKETIKRCRPIVIFEHGQGASDFYGTTPEMIHDFFSDLDMKISTLRAFIKEEKKGMTSSELAKQYTDKINYYFIAHI